MSANDIEVLKHPGSTLKLYAEDRTTSGLPATMLPGEPVKVASSGANYVTLISTGDPEVGTDEFVGIVRKESTETASADGRVEVTTIVPGKTVLRGKATTSSNINTAAKLYGVMHDWVCFDAAWTSSARGSFTIDEDEGSDPDVHGLNIIDGDIIKGTLDVLVHTMAQMAGPYY